MSASAKSLYGKQDLANADIRYPGYIMNADALVKGQSDHCTKAEYTGKVFFTKITNGTALVDRVFA